MIESNFVGGNESSGNSIGGGLASSSAVAPQQPNPWLSGLGSGLQSFGSSPSSISPPQFGALPSFAAPAQQTSQLGGLIPESQAGVDDLIALIQKLLSGGSTGGYG